MAIDLDQEFYELVEQMPVSVQSGITTLQRIQLLEAAMKQVAQMTNAFTTTTAAFIQPAVAGEALVSVETVVWMEVGQPLFIWNGPTLQGGLYTLISKSSSTQIVVRLETSAMNSAQGVAIPSGSSIQSGASSMVEFATILEVLAETETLKPVSPATLAGKNATAAEALAGTATNLLVSPSTLQGKLSDLWTGTTAPREVWISAIAPTNRIEKGTRIDPYDGSTATKFDQIMKDLADPLKAKYLGTGSAIIHLLPGSFETLGDPEFAGGGWRLMSNWTLQGSGKGITTLSLKSDVTYANADMVVIHGTLTGTLINLHVKDMTVVGNFTTLKTTHPAAIRIGGVYLSGDDISLENVEFLDFGNNTSENFVVILGGYGVPAAGYWRNCVIRDCIYREHDSTSTLSTVFLVGGSVVPLDASDPARVVYYRHGAIIENNIVIGTNTTTIPINGFTIYNSDGAVCRNNIAYKCTFGYYEDYWKNVNTLITGNAFIACGIPIYIQNPDYPYFQRYGYIISNNILSFKPDPYGASGITINGLMYNGTFVNVATRIVGDFIIQNNIILHSQAPVPGDNSLGIQCKWVQGLTIANNIFDTQIEFPLRLHSTLDEATGNVYDNSGVVFHDNYDLDGELIEDQFHEYRQTNKSDLIESNQANISEAELQSLLSHGISLEDITLVTIAVGVIDLDGVQSNLLYLTDLSGTITDIINGIPYAKYTLIIPADSGASAGVTHNTAKITVRSGSSIASAAYTRSYTVIPLTPALVMIED